MNRVILAPVIGLCIFGGIVLLLLCGLLFGGPESKDDCIVGFIINCLLLLIILWSSKEQFWIYCRLSAMVPTNYKRVNVFLEKEKAILTDEESNIKFEYNVKKKQLYIMRYMFINPCRHVKEYEERKYQLITRMDKTQIPYNGWMTDPNHVSFHVKIGLKKKDATPKNIAIIRSILFDLSKEDYNQNLYTKFQFDDDYLYAETYHYKLLRGMLASPDGRIERVSSDSWSEPSRKFSDILNKAYKKSILDKVTPSNFIVQETFDDLWEKGMDITENRQ